MPVERNKEIIRQWNILKQIASARDCSVAKLAGDHHVCQRTIYRDIAALEGAGFPLYQEAGEGCQYWRLSDWPFRHLHDTAFTFPELCAFYMSRGRIHGSGAGLDGDIESAMAKVTKALSPQMKTYLDNLQAVFSWKPEPKPVAGRLKPITVDTIVKATVEHRKMEMDYYSLSGGKVKSYEVEPHRLTAGNGGLYIYAYVAAYGQMRTFAVQRIRRLRVLEETFNPVEVSEPYKNSIGIASGRAELVEVAFAAKLAPYIEERTWHETQQVTRQTDGSIVLSLRVSIDVPLRTWILGFGHMARVLAPSSLAKAILEELEEAREQYAPKMKFELPPAIYDDLQQPQLPFQRARPSRAGRGEGSQSGRRQPSRSAPNRSR